MKSEMREKRPIGIGGLWAVVPVLAMLALGTVSCAVVTSSAVSAGAKAASATFVQRTATSEVDFPIANARLVPLAITGNAAGSKITAATASGATVTLASSDAAFAAVSGDIASITAGNSAGPVVAGLYSYYNSAYGQIQPDGSVKLTYQGTPVWMFSAPLAHYVDQSQGPPPIPGQTLKPQPERSGCSYIYIVDATTAVLMTWWQNCTEITPASS